MVIFKSLYNIKLRIPNNITIGSLSRYFSTKLEQSSKGTYSLAPFKDILECTDKNTENILRTGIEVYTNFITTEEETSLFDEVHNYLRRLRYEKSHWDDAIHWYRELEKREWSEKNLSIIERLRDTAFPPQHRTTDHLDHVHILDLRKDGYIKAHVDSVRYCGHTVSGMCLLSPSVMRFANEKEPSLYADVLLPRRCLYIMRHRARYEYTHEILADEESYFRGEKVEKVRRISVICRNSTN